MANLNDLSGTFALKSSKNTYITCNDQGELEARAIQKGDWERWHKGTPPSGDCVHIAHKWHKRYFIGEMNGKVVTHDSPNATDSSCHWKVEEGKYLRNAHNLKYLAIEKGDGNFKLTLVYAPTPECVWQKDPF
ncbi:hypothetical protein C4553_01075 [Candidatus Parcubacteria bacterium]|nr:MAG: hypothetical protein C4553_01075 [Candidatus Parcubacteria bacterium]